MSAAATFAAWQGYARGHSCGADNLFTLEGAVYSFDAHPRELKNGALVGRVYCQRGAAPVDIGGFKIGADGDVLEIPDELLRVLPLEAPAPRAAFRCPCPECSPQP